MNTYFPPVFSRISGVFLQGRCTQVIPEVYTSHPGSVHLSSQGCTQFIPGVYTVYPTIAGDCPTLNPSYPHDAYHIKIFPTRAKIPPLNVSGVPPNLGVNTPPGYAGQNTEIQKSVFLYLEIFWTGEEETPWLLETE